MSCTVGLNTGPESSRGADHDSFPYDIESAKVTPEPTPPPAPSQHGLGKVLGMDVSVVSLLA